MIHVLLQARANADKTITINILKSGYHKIHNYELTITAEKHSCKCNQNQMLFWQNQRRQYRRNKK